MPPLPESGGSIATVRVVMEGPTRVSSLAATTYEQLEMKETTHVGSGTPNPKGLPVPHSCSENGKETSRDGGRET